MSTYELNRLDPITFEHLATSLALRELGAGLTTFAPGRDGGRDGYFEGSAPYPSKSNKWSGTWYVQAKYFAPSLSTNPQRWLLTQVRKELEAFARPDSGRTWPDHWIIITNVDPTAVAKGGSFDQTREAVRAARPSLVSHFHIWGGSKVLDLLSKHQDVASRYGDFVTAGHLVSAAVKSHQARFEVIVHSLIVKGMEEQQFAKLEQAGSQQFRPGIHHLFTDVPLLNREHDVTQYAVEGMYVASRKSHVPELESLARSPLWMKWRRHPSRARIWFVRGGPGQGKSTIAQYFAQVQRAWFILQGEVGADPKQRALADEIRTSAKKFEVWPARGRIPIIIELKDFAQWFSEQGTREAKGFLSYLSRMLTARVEESIDVGTIRELLSQNRWFVVFDGLDEVPPDVKEMVAAEVGLFLRHVVVEAKADVFAICTSRPQGYSGQFDELDACAVELLPLTTDQAVECAKPVLALQQSPQEAGRDVERLRKAAQRPGVRELMVTPLQAHIMAIVVRGGARAPDRRWKLFNNFYEVIRKREATRDLPDENLARVLRDEELLLKTVHNRVGFALQALAETSAGAHATLERKLFARIVKAAVTEIKQRDIEITVKTLMNATTERLVLVNTPDDGDHVRFDVRQLQEFFAAEYLYDSIHVDQLPERVELIAGDAHWREVTQFLVSGLIEDNRQTELEVTANVLLRIDSDPAEGLRAIRRKLARGAMVTAKLLAEGVLEQDLRMRERLRHTLDAAFASTEFAVIEPLLRVMQPNSFDWLVNTAIDALRERQPAEHIGAVNLLTRVVGDSDPRRDTLIAALDAADPEFLALVARSRSDAPGDVPFAQWFIRVLIRSLTRPGALNLSARGLRSIVGELCRYSQPVLEKRSQEAGLSLDDSRLVQWLTDDPNPSIGGDTGYIVAIPEYFATDWSTGNVPRHIVKITETGGTGTLGLLYRIAAFSRMKRQRELQALLDAIESNVRFAAGLPPHVRAHIPIDFERDAAGQIAILRRLDDDDVVNLAKTQQAGGFPRPRPTTFTIDDRQTVSIDQWSSLVNDWPDVALRVWRRCYARNVNGARADELLVRKLLKEPTALLTAPGLWGQLVTDSVTGRDIRNRILAVAAVFLPRAVLTELSTFQLQLPREAALLPHLLDAVFATGRAVTDPFEYVENFVKQLTSIDDLRRCRDDVTLEGRDRLAACVFAWMHPEGEGLDEDAAALSFLSSTRCDPVITSRVTAALNLWATPGTTREWNVVSQVVDHLRDRFRDRDLLDDLFASWRERSSAPVKQARRAEAWLKIEAGGTA